MDITGLPARKAALKLLDAVLRFSAFPEIFISRASGRFRNTTITV